MARKPAAKSTKGKTSQGTGSAAGEKVGSDERAAEHFGGKGDFGIPVDKAQPGQQTEAGGGADVEGRPLGTKMPPRSGEGLRDTGVGAPASGPGSGSGGDLDPDIIGFGTGGGVAASPERRTTGPDITETATDTAAVGGPAKGDHNLRPGTHGAGDPVEGSTIDRGDREVHLGAGDTGDSRMADDDLPGTTSSGDRAAGEDVDDREAQVGTED